MVVDFASAISISPEGRNEAGEGKILEGAVGGDIPGGNLGDAADGKEGVEAWRPTDGNHLACDQPDTTTVGEDREEGHCRGLRFYGLCPCAVLHFCQ